MILSGCGTCWKRPARRFPYLRGSNRAGLQQSQLLTYGLVRCLEIIGEAAARMSDGSRELLPSVPWQQIIGMRNRLIHAYFDVDTDMVWRTVSEDLPRLIVLLNEIIDHQPTD